MDKYEYNVTKHDMVNGATLIDTGSAYMFLLPTLYHRVFEIVSNVILNILLANNYNS